MLSQTFSILHISHLPFSGFDTIIMNPPFGTRNTGIDAEFVTIAMKNARSVYSLHKTSTRDVRTC